MSKPLNSNELWELAATVFDEAGFVSFLAEMSASRSCEVEAEAKSPGLPYGPGALGWENGSIEAFLDRAADWGEATANGTQYYSVPENPWQRAAQILCAGVFYE